MKRGRDRNLLYTRNMKNTGWWCRYRWWRDLIHPHAWFGQFVSFCPGWTPELMGDSVGRNMAPLYFDYRFPFPLPFRTCPASIPHQRLQTWRWVFLLLQYRYMYVHQLWALWSHGLHNTTRNPQRLYCLCIPCSLLPGLSFCLSRMWTVRAPTSISEPLCVEGVRVPQYVCDFKVFRAVLGDLRTSDLNLPIKNFEVTFYPRT